MSCSHARRLPSPACASTFCSRTPSWSLIVLCTGLLCLSVVGRSGIWFGYIPLTLRLRVGAGSALGDLGGIELVYSREERCELRQLVKAAQAKALQEVGRRPVKDGASLMLSPGLFHQAARNEGPHDRVHIDAADRRYPDPADGLTVSNDREGLQRRLGEPGMLPVADEPFDHGRVVAPGIEPPATGDLTQVEAAALFGVLRSKLTEGRRAFVRRLLDDLRQRGFAHRVVHDEQDRLEGGTK